MAAPARKRSRRKSSGSGIAVLAILLLIAAALAGYYFLAPSPLPQVQLHKADSTPAIPVSPVRPDSYPAPDPKNTSEAIPPAPFPHQNKPDIIHPPKPITPENNKPGSAVRLAIIIDDMGGSLSEARALASIKVPLTFALIPGLRSDRDVAAFAAGNAIETMIHVPMQSHGWPARRLEANGLLTAMDTVELQERMGRFIHQLPGAVGVNNHMGSEFTEREDKMTAVLQMLKKHNLFFVDSVTSPESAGFRVARQLGVRTAKRNVFIDNEQEQGYITGQINQAVRIARKNGTAIAIGHPHPSTIATLAAVLPGLEAQGVQLVYASQLVK